MWARAGFEVSVGERFMRNRVVMYSVVGVVALGLIAIAAFKSRHPASSSVADVAPVAPVPQYGVSKRAQAKVVHPVAKPIAPIAVDAAAGPLPRSYRVLLAHSLFSSQPTTSADKSAMPTDGQLKLCGVLQQGRQFVAYVENATSGQGQQLRVGDSVGLGKLVAIDLYSIRYTAPGRDMRVEVGQSFNSARKVATAQTSSMETLRQITE